MESHCQDPDYNLLFDLMTQKDLTVDNHQIDDLSRIVRDKVLLLNLILFDQAKGGIIIGAQKKNLRDLVIFNSVFYLPKLQKIQNLIQAHLQ